MTRPDQVAWLVINQFAPQKKSGSRDNEGFYDPDEPLDGKHLEKTYKFFLNPYKFQMKA